MTFKVPFKPNHSVILYGSTVCYEKWLLGNVILSGSQFRARECKFYGDFS